MGRKRIGKRIKRIVLHAGNEVAYFDLDNEEKLIMSKTQKNQILKRMKRKMNEILSQNTPMLINNIETTKEYFNPAPVFTDYTETESTPDTPDIPPPQEEPKIITITIDRSNEEQCEDQYISHLTHLFQMNHDLE